MASEKYSVGVIEHEVAILAGMSALHKNLGVVERPEYVLLRQINEYGLVGIKELADEFGLDRAIIMKHVAILESEGCIKRVPSGSDDKTGLFRSTQLGRDRLHETKQMRLSKYSSMLKRWTNGDLQKFGELLSLLNRTLKDE
ncbi:MarR family winged helix-turn-helix transcriptional regulator [Alicyclobacillus dauci]|uniref:MarR family transcriptional regulator n=1 Tax=Alicyclobacillus dauci TaxID=1475485 RepID=A0ABY6Z5Y4_9BACL|nr:MarR family transcriptional regulator [Alicyclobacillus dauci]WAH38292.1 MarR family transcriptional regulator [Alicyclobacillus dauci]